MKDEKTKKSFFENPILRSKVKSANVKFPEMLFGYFIGPFGALLSSGILNSFLNIYWQNYVFTDSATNEVVKNFMFIMPLISTILVVAANILVGQLIERVKTRAGKARPWILLSAVVLTAACIILFIQPFTEDIAKMIWVTISYNLYYAVAYPLYNTANSTLIPVSTRNSSQRSLLASFTNVAGLGVMGAGSMVFPILMGTILSTSWAWTLAFIIVGIFSFVCCLLQYFFTRERITEESMKESKDGEVKVEQKRIPMGKQVKSCVTDKFWWLIIGAYFLFQVSGAVKNLSMVNFCYTNMGALTTADAGLVQTILAVAGAVPMAIASVLCWPLSNKIGKKNLVIIGFVLGVIGGVLAILGADVLGGNVGLIGTGIALKCLGSSPMCYMILAMIADVLDHLEAKNGYRSDGFTMSIYSSIMVAATGIGTGIINATFGAAGGWVAQPEGVTDLVQQSEAIVRMASFNYVWIETIAYAACAVIFFFFLVEKNLKAEQRAIIDRQREEALARGEEWIEPEERLRRQEEQANIEAEEARKAELKSRCEKKGLNYEEEEAKYQAKLAEKKAAAEAKAAAKAAKKASTEPASDDTASAPKAEAEDKPSDSADDTEQSEGKDK